VVLGVGTTHVFSNFSWTTLTGLKNISDIGKIVMIYIWKNVKKLLKLCKCWKIRIITNKEGGGGSGVGWWKPHPEAGDASGAAG
jgi:hypothetical protein